MTSISNAQHETFCRALRNELAKEGGGTTLMDRRLEEYLRHMERLRGEYMQHLKALQVLVGQYETARKEARILLRKRLAAQKQLAARKAKAMNRTVSRAS